MKKVIYFKFFCFIFFCSCGQEKIPLKEHELKLLPYKGNETLIYKSNHGDYDTMMLKGIRLGYPDGATLLKYYPQIAVIHGNFSNPNPPGKMKHEYLYGRLFEVIAKTPEKEAMLGIYLKAKSSVFYGHDILPLSELNGLKEIQITINNQKLTDVLVIEADTTARLVKPFLKRKDFVTTMYWSKSHGLVQWRKKDGEIWTKIN